jgi:TRAP transporter TAXI family solute receptor
MKKWLILLLVTLLTFGVIAGCGSNQSINGEEGSSQENSNGESSTNDSNDQASDTSKDNSSTEASNPLEGKIVTILTGGTSGVYFPLGNALAKIYNEHSGANASSQTTGASAENAAKVSQKTAELAFAMADTVADAYNGDGKFEQTGALDNLRGVSALYTNYMQIVAKKDSGINSIVDLKDKKVAVGAPGSGTEIMANRVLEAAGLSYDDIDEDFLSFKEGVEGIKNNIIDAVFIISGLPNAGVLELATTEEIVIVNVPIGIVEQLQGIYPAFVSANIPGGTYEGIDQDVETAAVKNLLITHADLSEAEVYELTKQFYENLQVLRDTHNAANGIELEKATIGLPIPLHPGAEKYYKEQGVLN